MGKTKPVSRADIQLVCDYAEQMCGGLYSRGEPMRNAKENIKRIKRGLLAMHRTACDVLLVDRAREILAQQRDDDYEDR